MSSDASAEEEIDDQTSPSTPSIRLVIWVFEEDSEVAPVSLTIPIDVIHAASIAHITWLRYVSWAILGLPGYISNSAGGDAIDEDDTTPLQAESEFYYVTPEGKFVKTPHCPHEKLSPSSCVQIHFSRH